MAIRRLKEAERGISALTKTASKAAASVQSNASGSKKVTTSKPTQTHTTTSGTIQRMVSAMTSNSSSNNRPMGVSKAGAVATRKNNFTQSELNRNTNIGQTGYNAIKGKGQEYAGSILKSAVTAADDFTKGKGTLGKFLENTPAGDINRAIKGASTVAGLVRAAGKDTEPVKAYESGLKTADKTAGKMINAGESELQTLKEKATANGKHVKAKEFGLDAAWTAADVAMDVGLTRLAPGTSEMTTAKYTSKAGQIVGGIAKRGGNRAVGDALMGMRSYGAAKQQALEAGASEEEADRNGLVNAATEIMSERLFSANKILAGTYGQGFADSVVDTLQQKLVSKVAGKTRKEVADFVSRNAASMLEEGLEEIVAEGIEPRAANLIYGNALKEEGIENTTLMVDDLASRYNLNPQMVNTLKDKINNGASDDSIAMTLNDLMASGVTQDEAREILASYMDANSKIQTADYARSFGLGAVVGGIFGGVSNVSALNQARDVEAEAAQYFGEGGINEALKKAMASEDAGTAAKASALYDELQSTGSISNVAAKEMLDAAVMQDNMDSSREQSSRSAAARSITEQNYANPFFVNEDGSIEHTGTSQSVMDSVTQQTAQIISSTPEMAGLSESEVQSIASAVGSYAAGTLTAKESNVFAYENTEARAAFQEVTGLELPVVTANNGTVNVAETNKATKDFLFGGTATNAVDVARQETDAMRTNLKGQTEQAMLNNLGAKGQEAFAASQDAMPSAMPRDIAENAQGFKTYYDAGRNGRMVFSAVDDMIGSQFKNIPEETRRAAYEAGQEDAKRSIREASRQGEVISRIAEENRSQLNSAPERGVLSIELDTADGTAIHKSQIELFRLLAESLNLNIHIVSGTNPMVQGSNGAIKVGSGDMYLNATMLGEGHADRVLEYVFGHEITHHIKIYAPEEYARLENLVRQRWYERDSNGMSKAIRDKQKLYKDRVNQELTESEALEEIIADATYEMFNDEEFMTRVAEQEPALGKAILNAIQKIMANIREVLARGRGFTPRQNAELFSQLDILKEAEELWLNGLATARLNAAAVGNLEYASERFSLKNKNINPNDRIPYVENDSYINVPRGDAEALNSLEASVKRIQRESFENAATGYKASITSETVGKIIHPSKKMDRFGTKHIRNLNAAVKLPQLFENAVYVDTKNNQKKRGSSEKLHHFVAPIRMNGEEYRARIVARDRVNTDILYIINVEIFPIKKGTPLASDNASQSRGVPMDISIHELTKNVKIYDYYKADNEYYGFSDLKFSVRDQEYMDAVESGDMKKAQQMVGEAAKATGYATPDLYHGTSRFGFTGFDVEQNTDSKGLIYTTTKSVVSANYAGRDNYAGVRTIGRPYIQNATTNEDILSNANNVYGTNYRMATKDDRNSILKEVYDEALSIANKLNNLGTDSWNFEMTDQFSNDLAWSENMFWTITQEGEFSNIENIEEYFDDVQTLAESLREDIEQYHERYERLRNYLLENRDKIGDKGENSLYRLLLSYDFTDAAIDIEYKYYRALAIDRLAINDATDSINSIEQIKESSDATHGIGSYHLYGKLGENPYIMDANGKSWLNLEADIIDGVHSTDAIAKKAKELGYTSVVMKNIYDGGEMADNYIFFNSNQLKSADPVTYDDEGNVIPLSKRFNQDNKDIRFSISDVDSDGNALSEQQREYFKDSKVRDENGNLLVMYHGTSAAFTVFDKGHIGGTGRFEGSGFNFTSFEGRAMSYDTSGNGNTFRVYLNITNPISDKEKTLTKAKLTSIVRAIARNEDVDGFDSIVFAIHPPMKRTGRESFPESLRATVEYLLEYNESDADIYAAISTLGTYDEAVIEAFENEGYDGVIWHDYDESVKTAIAFEPEQIKNIDNLNPTADPDIRFSVNDDDMYKPTEGTVDNLWEGLNIGVRFSHGEGGTFFSSGIKTNRTTDKPTQAAINNNRMKSGKDMLEKALSENYGKGWRDEFSRVVSFMEAMNDFFVDAGTKYRFIGLQDVENSTVRVRRDGKKITGITMSAMIKNGEYPINFDFTTICKKRQAFNDVIEKLTKNKNVGEDISLSAAELMDINEALRAEGVETACLGCFVEARRYNMQNYTEKVVQKWNDAVDAYAKENGIKLEDIPDFNFANGQEATDQDFIDAADTFLSYKKSSMSKKNPGARFAAIIAESKGAYVKHLHAADLVTKQGVERIMDMGTRDKSFYGMLKAAYGVAAPKEIVKFVPYNSEIANLPKTKNKMPMDEYLKSIGGIRMQSFSDFLVANTFDYMQMVADAAARGFTAHAYTKEIAFARIFGKTGIKINMSVMFDVMSPQEWGDVLGISDQDRLKTIAKTYAGMQFFKSESDIPEELKDSAVKKKIAGVDGWLTYLVGDEDRSNRGWEQLYKEAYELTGDEETATQIANEGRNWVQSINFREAKELQKQEGYAENVGVIAVGLSDENIRHMMNDDNIPYIIPYHASGLPEVIKQRTNLNNATDYTDTQNTRIFVKATAPDGTEYNSFDEFKKLKGDRGWKEFYKWLAEEGYKLEGRGPKTWKETNDDGKEKTITEINPHTKRKYELHGTGEFDVYDPLEKGNTPQQLAEQYMEDCAEQGLLPVFYQFAGEDGYYKVLFDYSVVNLSNGATAPQQKVRNNYPGVDVDAGESDYSQLQKIIDDEMKKQNEINERRDAVVEKVANDFADKLTKHSLRDEEYRKAYENGDVETAQRLVDEAANDAGYDVDLLHGTHKSFTVFNSEVDNMNYGSHFAPNKDGKTVAHTFAGETGKIMKLKGSANSPWDTFDMFADDRQYMVYALNESIRKAEHSEPDKAVKAWELFDKLKDVEPFNGEEYEYLFDRNADLDEIWPDEDIGVFDDENKAFNDIVWEIVNTLGYDSMRYENIMENTSNGQFEKDYVIRHPSQIKSADPFTFDDAGELVPLSERFNPNSDDIRYSITNVDSEGNELSQGQRDHFANSKVTDEKGNLLKMYHGTESVGFTIFDPEMSDDGISLFFTDNIENAASYSDSFDAVDLDDEDREDSGNYAVYLNITNPYVVDADGRYWDQLILESDSSEYTVRMTDLDEDEWTCHLELIDSDGNVEIDEEWDLDDFRDEFYHRGMDEETIESLRDGEEEEVVVMLASEGNELSTRDIAEIAKEKGHDGVIFKSIVDYGQYSDGDFERPSTVIVAFNSEQIKLVDNLDPTNNPDIRFSLKLSDDYVVNNEDEFDELPVHDARILQSHNRREATKSEIAQRADAMRKDTRVTKGKVVDVKSIEPAVRELIMFTMEDSASGKRYKQSLVKSTVQAVKLMYTKIQEDDFNAAAEIAYDTALEIAENITLVNDDMWEQYKELRDYIKKTPMALADQDKQNIPDYSEWRKANFGNFRIKSDGLPVYTMYSQLNEMWPEFFSADITHPADQAMRIADVMEQLKPYEYAYTSEEADALAKELSNDLCNIAFAGTSWKSYADKAKEKLARETAALKQRHMEAQNDIRTAERIAAGRKVAKVKNQYESKIESMRSKYESKLDAEKQKVKDVKQSEKEKRQAQQWLAVERETAVKDQAEMKRQKQQERHNAKVKKLTENANMRVAREKRKLQDYRSRVAEQKAKKKTFKERAKHFGKIKDNYMWLTSRLLKPKKDKHIPEEFRVALSEVLQMFDLQTERSRQLEAKYGKAKSTSKLDDLRTALERISSEEGSDSVFVYNGHIFQLIDSLAAKMRNGLSVDQFGDKELKEVDILLTAIRHNIANQNQAFADGIKRKITELAEDSFDAFAKRVELYGEKATLTGVRSYVDSILNEAAVTPRDFFDLIGGGLNTVFLKGLRKGHDKHIMNIDYVRKEFDVLFKPYAKTSLFHKNRGSAPGSEIEGWRDSTNVQTFKLGETAIKMTPAQMMSLYCLIKREQAAGHVFGSGFVVTEIDPTVQTKNIAKTIAQGVRSGVGMKLQNNNVKVMISYEEAQEIVGKLSPDQIKMANSLQQMLEGKCADWGNETSMKLFGYKMFKEKNYFPIQSAHEYLNTDYGKHQNVEKIKNFGFTKPLEAGANNAIVIDDIFDVVADHINKMSLYNAFACPISDMTRLMNTVVYNDDGTQADSIKAELKRAYGNNALRYVETFLADVQTQQQTRKDGMRNVITRSLANQKKALIGFSLSVLVQQPTAIVRAFNEIDVKWFANADSAHIKTNIAEMKAHCPIALWKSWGFSQLEMANSIDQIMMNKEWSRVDLVTMQPYGFADMVTWSFIWAAVKNEVSAKNPSVEYGSDEYWELCNDRASEVFDLTQVVDSPMHRSQAMRNDDIMIKQMMSFMAEPTRTLNMLRTNIIKARELKKTGNDKQAANMLAKTTTVFVANAAACSAAKAFVDAFRDQFGGDEPDYENFLESWLNNFLHNLKSNANPITMTPFFKDLWQLGEGFGPSNTALEGWEKLITGVVALGKSFTNGGEGLGKAVWKFTQGIGYVTGIPIKNFARDVNSTLNFFGIQINPLAAEKGDDSDMLKLLEAAEETGEYVAPYTRSIDGANKSNGKFLKLFEIKEGCGFDNFLDKHGFTLSDAEYSAKLQEERAKYVEDKVATYSGDERKKQINSAVTGNALYKDKTYSDGAKINLSNAITHGDYATVKEMREIIENCGGDLEAFDKSVESKTGSAYRKLVGDDSYEAWDKRDEMETYLRETKGWTQDDISHQFLAGTYGGKKCELAKQFQVAFAEGNETEMFNTLVSLYEAGLTDDDYQQLVLKASSATKAYDYSSGSFGWPAENNAGQIVQHIGTNGSDYTTFATDSGTGITAADGGKVTFVGVYKTKGAQVVIDHGNGYKSYYTGMTAFNVPQGRVLRKGDVIAYSGGTFALKVTYNGQVVDPEQVLNM